jgi:hypothetical protein
MKKVIKANKDKYVISIEEIKDLIDKNMQAEEEINFILLCIKKEDTQKIKFLKYKFWEMDGGWDSLYCSRNQDSDSIPDFYGYIETILDSDDEELLYFDTEKEAIIWLADHYYRNLG